LQRWRSQSANPFGLAGFVGFAVAQPCGCTAQNKGGENEGRIVNGMCVSSCGLRRDDCDGRPVGRDGGRAWLGPFSFVDATLFDGGLGTPFSGCDYTIGTSSYA